MPEKLGTIINSSTARQIARIGAKVAKNSFCIYNINLLLNGQKASIKTFVYSPAWHDNNFRKKLIFFLQILTSN